MFFFFYVINNTKNIHTRINIEAKQTWLLITTKYSTIHIWNERLVSQTASQPAKQRIQQHRLYLLMSIVFCTVLGIILVDSPSATALPYMHAYTYIHTYMHTHSHITNIKFFLKT